MRIIKDADAVVRSIRQGRVPDTILQWVKVKLLKTIWICKDGRSRFVTEIAPPYTVHKSGYLLSLSGSIGPCFRNLHLERVVKHICTIVDCSAADAALSTTGNVVQSVQRHPSPATANRRHVTTGSSTVRAIPVGDRTSTAASSIQANAARRAPSSTAGRRVPASSQTVRVNQPLASSTVARLQHALPSAQPCRVDARVPAADRLFYYACSATR